MLDSRVLDFKSSSQSSWYYCHWHWQCRGTSFVLLPVAVSATVPVQPAKWDLNLKLRVQCQWHSRSFVLQTSLPVAG